MQSSTQAWSKNSTSTFLPVLWEGNGQCSPNGKHRDCRHGSMSREFVSPFPSCWPGQQQTLNPKIRTLSSPSSILLLQPNAKTKALHKLELCLLVVPRQRAIYSLPVASTTSDRNGSFEGKSWKGRQRESLGLFYITDVCHVLAADNGQGKMRQITIWDSKTK